jgi:23S rRNA pseudouridine1911/1915/1917 synthase
VNETPEPLVVPAALDGERLDRAVALLTGWSRNAVQELVDGDLVLVAGKRAAKSRRLVAGEVVELLAMPEAPVSPGPEPVPVAVRHVDDDVIVVSKPAGLVVHPGAGHPHGTLVHGLLARFPEIAGVGDPSRPGIVHRLDRDTSGLIVVARSERAYHSLVGALSAREVDRWYLALVHGEPDPPRGIVDAPIGRSNRRRTRMAVREGGRDARTVYEVRGTSSSADVALLDCRLETGRTHQIRVHLAAIGHPVVGDAAYGGARENVRLERAFLHAHSLGFRHPGSGEALRFDEPLPGELQAVLDRLGLGGEPGPSGGVREAGQVADTTGSGPGWIGPGRSEEDGDR